MPNVEMKFSYHHVVIFCLTFLSYSFFHATRKTLSNVKSSISDEWTIEGFFKSNRTHLRILPNETWNSRSVFEQKEADIFLGYMDTSFMLFYAFGLFLSGYLGDKFELRKVLSFGMFSSGIVVLCFGYVTEVTHTYKKYLYMILMVLNGLLQSLGWPCVVAIMGNWFGKSSRGFILGLWSSCASVGNIIGALVTARVLKYGYEYSFLITSTFLIGLAIINFFSLISSPADLLRSRKYVYEPIVDANEDPLLPEEIPEEEDEDKDEAIRFLDAFMLPGVLLCAFAYAFLKLVNYSFFFWLPLYLDRNFHWSEDTADKISIWYDVGGIIGGTVAGYVSDRIGRRGIVVVPMLIFAIPSLVLYSYLPTSVSKNMNAFILSICGLFIGGVASLISAAISADLGQQKTLSKNKRALATVTGIIDGTGSLGAAIGQVTLPYIETAYNWEWVFYMFVIMTVLTIACLMPMFIRDARETLPCCKRRNNTDAEVSVDPPVRERQNTAPYSDPPPSYDEIS
ncbi:sugar phosphate exchanger 3-like isoform X1 [Octopus vulgaris]|uniref:Sugar phosphate exchanger 3-like isoform X1 n=2 Tax=Octopus TaxID=6643 RepID=A0AA36BV07_OCTVU|nr:sugar phosphate exchanger 3 isoform X12 [Octopus sinensis]CAI9740252.1 sugar phosphate exchanger 3-like isoform X1 [Octopus vulgaris]